MSRYADEVHALSEQLRPLLAHRGPDVQGAALADLLATWLAGHGSRDPVATKKLREELLEGHIKIVRMLSGVAHE